ncbi:MAG: hypothetical protein L3J59_13125 [Methylococcaceae bacterium]|nr:hypothetical protein [Methylococcaceae bacterium]
MKILLILIALLPSVCLSKNITYLDYKFTIPDNFKVIENDLSETSAGLFILKDEKTAVFGIKKMRKNDKYFFQPEDYGLSTHRELFYVLFNDDVASTNKNIIEVREVNKKFPLQKQSISKRDNFVFFRTNNSMGDIGSVSFLISTPQNDEILKIDFLDDHPSEKLIKSIIDSLEVK